MKKFILLTTLAIAFTFSATAQVKTSIGFKGGVNVNQFTGDVQNSKIGTAPMMGGFFNLSLADKAQLQFEALYERSLGDFSEDSIDYAGKIDYLDVPVLFKFRIPAKENIYPYISIGQNVGYRLSDNTQQFEQGDNGFVDADNHFKPFNLATIIGAGVDLESELVFFSIDARYVHGNINISNTQNTINTSGLSLTAGVGFKLTKRNQ